MVLPIADRKAYPEQDRGFLRFLLLGILILVAEIVISVVITEEGKVLLPHKLLYRYFQMFELPLLLVYLKGRERFRLPGWIWPVYIAVFTYLGFYFAAMGDRQRIGIIDAPIFLLIDNITQRFLPHFNPCLRGCRRCGLLYVGMAPEASGGGVYQVGQYSRAGGCGGDFPNQSVPATLL